ncbi:MAG: hypothetical protein CO090_03970 [Acidobacteria bacterium CG_4_9_14_3_um_filter_49_7]|nr:MAG: hypothetical protein CO090_03970 [Acidobacteria bacterium CG_4_9_14_3_um_filter_49_7]
MRTLYLLFFVLLTSVSCGNGTSLEQFDGFRFGETRQQVIETAKKNDIAMNIRFLSYWQRYGETPVHIRFVFHKKTGKLYAFDIKGLPCKKPEDARNTMFELKAYFEGIFGPASASVISHPNFDVVNYKWTFKNATVYLGTTIVQFQTIPRMLVIENQD